MTSMDLLCRQLAIKRISVTTVGLVSARRRGNAMSAAVVNYMRKIWFRIRWFTMSDRERYAYLWNRTKSSHWYPAHLAELG